MTYTWSYLIEAVGVILLALILGSLAGRAMLNRDDKGRR